MFGLNAELVAFEPRAEVADDVLVSRQGSERVDLPKQLMHLSLSTDMCVVHFDGVYATVQAVLDFAHRGGGAAPVVPHQRLEGIVLRLPMRAVPQKKPLVQRGRSQHSVLVSTALGSAYCASGLQEGVGVTSRLLLLDASLSVRRA